MKLITELSLTSFDETEYITEAKENGKKEHYICGPFMEAEVTNRNGRKYPISVMESAVEKYVNTHIKNSRGFGELGHPAGPQINLDRVSHMITELNRDGSSFTFMGKAKIANTPMGNIAKGLLESGAKLGVSSRGMGTLEPKDGIMVVQPDFQIATAADIVADPSAPNAFVKGIMEGHEWVYDSVKGLWQEELLHETKKQLRKLTMDGIESKQLSIFENYVKSLAKIKLI